jgi:hypothetical protein
VWRFKLDWCGSLYVQLCVQIGKWQLEFLKDYFFILAKNRHRWFHCWNIRSLLIRIGSKNSAAVFRQLTLLPSSSWSTKTTLQCPLSGINPYLRAETVFLIKVHELWYIRNHRIHEDLQMNTVLNEIKQWNTKCLIKLENHTNALAVNLLDQRWPT